MVRFLVIAMICFASAQAGADVRERMDKRTGETASVRFDSIGGMKYACTVSVGRNPAATFAKLTDCGVLCDALGAKERQCPKRLDRVGAAATMNTGDRGTLVVTRVKKDEELCFAWTPDNGTYVCGFRFRLHPAPTGTTIDYEDMFTLSGPMSKADRSKYADDVFALKDRLEAALGK